MYKTASRLAIQRCRDVDIFRVITYYQYLKMPAKNDNILS